MTSDTFPSFLKPSEITTFRERIKEIASAGSRQRLGFLIGAGFSFDARKLPLSSGLAATLLQQTYGCLPEIASSIAQKYELAAIAQQHLEGGTERRAGLVKAIQKVLTAKLPESQAEKDFAAIVSKCKLRRVFTTNYDSLIGDCLGKRGRIVVPTADGVRVFEDESRDLDCTGIFHLNGDLKDPRVAEEELRRHRSVFYEVLRHELLTKVFVMLGYSFRDDVLQKVFGEVVHVLDHTSEQRSTYIVMPIDEEYEFRVAQEVWKSRGHIQLLPLRAGAFLIELQKALEDQSYTKAIKRIADGLNVDIDDVDKVLKPKWDTLAAVTHSDLATVVQKLLEAKTS